MNSSNIDLRALGIELARMVAGLAVDPHGYFEKKYTARIENSSSDEEISSVLAQLLQWVGSSELSETECEKLNRELADRGFPTIDDLRLQYLP